METEKSLVGELNSYFETTNEVLKNMNQILGFVSMNLGAANTAAEMKEIIKASLFMDRNSEEFQEIKRLLWKKRMSNNMLVLSDFMDILDSSVSEEIPLVIDYSKTLERIIAENYECDDNNITSKNFPPPSEINGKVVNVSARILYWDNDYGSMTKDDVTSNMNDYGLRPANYMELLAYGIAYPELSRWKSIISIDQVWDYRKVICLTINRFRKPNQRPVITRLKDGLWWDQYYAVLGICK